MTRALAATLALMSFAPACASDLQACMAGRDLVGETPLPAEIADIFEHNCWICHTDPPAGFAPFPLLTWEQVQAPRSMDNPEPKYETIARRIHDPQFPMPPMPRPDLTGDALAAWPKLTDEEIATIDRWVADCAPPGE